MSERFMKKYDGQKLGWLKFGKQAAVIAVIAFLIFRFVIGISLVSGDSMLPTLEDKDIVAYLRIGSDYERGDVVSAKMPSSDYYVKRIVAVAGDTIDLKGDKVLINGKAIDEPYIQGRTLPHEGKITYPYEIKPGYVFVMGDNREESIDSRAFGALAESQIKGKLFFVE